MPVLSRLSRPFLRRSATAPGPVAGPTRPIRLAAAALRCEAASDGLGRSLREWLRGPGSNRRPRGYEPRELPLLYPASRDVRLAQGAAEATVADQSDGNTAL